MKTNVNEVLGKEIITLFNEKWKTKYNDYPQLFEMQIKFIPEKRILGEDSLYKEEKDEKYMSMNMTIFISSELIKNTDDGEQFLPDTGKISKWRNNKNIDNE